MFTARLLGPYFCAVLLCASVTATSANPFIIEQDPSEFTSSFALRYWYGLGSTRKDLYGFSRDDLVSRLSYTGVQSHSVEIYTRVDHTSSGLFWKGYAGGGLLTQGNLRDEDFPPTISPYSSTHASKPIARIYQHRFWRRTFAWP